LESGIHDAVWELGLSRATVISSEVEALIEEYPP